MKQVYKKEMYEKALQEALRMVDKNLDSFVDHYPHVSENHIYPKEENTLWTSSFYIGMCYLAYEMTGEERYLKHTESYLDSFSQRLENRIGISHDLGFLYTLSCVALYKLTGNQRARKLAENAATVLIERYNEKGQYIQAWGKMGIGYPDVKIIIDTMLNLPLLYWTEDPEKIDIAKNHAMTAAKYLVREDYFSYHTYLMNPESGEAVCGKTHQGYADESTWARGQAWAVYGFALSYGYTKEEQFLIVAKETAEVFIRNLPEDSVPYWDFTFTDANPDQRDTSAGSIFVCGLLELCNYVDEEQQERYHKIIDTVMQSLYHNYVLRTEETNGLLGEGIYHRNHGADECVIWGDYFYMEAIVRILNHNWNRYW